MRAGYLAALASRTLGVARVLQPPAPARFEPENSQAPWHDIVEVREPAPERPAMTRLPPPAAAETAAGEAPATDHPFHGLYAPDLGRSRPAPGRAERGGPAPDGRTVTGRTAAPPPDAIRVPGVPGPPGAVAAPPAGRVDLPPEPGGMLTSGPRQPDAGWAGPSRQQARAATMAAGPAAAAGAGPPVVVRIGRVEVRAVHTAPPAVPAPPPRPPAGPSLAEHLRARDRGRK